jgi:hypothetical protein
MKKIAFTLTLVAFIISLSPGRAQIGYSPVVDSLVNLITVETLTEWEEQLTGEVEVMISSQTETIVSRHSNNPSNALAAQWILEQFESFGLDAEFQYFGANGENVIAEKTGLVYPDKIYIICGHYDNMPSGPVAPGADDNASGTIGVLEAARLLSNIDLDYTVKFIAFDEEEQGLIGSYHYANNASASGEDILGVLNMDMISWDSDDDFEMSISVNDASMPFANMFISGMEIYAPDLNHNFISTTASDHAPFWYNGYQAILVIEDWNDFNDFYHTINDKMDYLNWEYFREMARASVATIASLALDLTLMLNHEPLASGVFTEDRVADLIISTNLGIPTGINAPRLYYKIENEDFEWVNAVETIGDTFRFIIPGQGIGTDVFYYFAVQDSSANLLSTLPYGGHGMNPPGTLPPAELYTYFVGEQLMEEYCSQSLPVELNPGEIAYDTIEVNDPGIITDMDILVSIGHNNVGDLDISLLGPDGTEIILSSGNGGSGSNFINTVFDDEAEKSITTGSAPFNGSYQPEQPLFTFDDYDMAGDWILKIENTGNTQGALVNYCATFNYYEWVGIEDPLINTAALYQNFPNPCRDFTYIKYDLLNASNVSLSVFDYLGREIIHLVNGFESKGVHSIQVNTSDLPAGRYFYRLQTDETVIVKSMMVIQ